MGHKTTLEGDGELPYGTRPLRNRLGLQTKQRGPASRGMSASRLPTLLAETSLGATVNRGEFILTNGPNLREAGGT